MNKNLNLLLKTITVIAFILSCLWSYYNFGFEPVIAAIVSLSALVGLFVEQKINKSETSVMQSQRSGDNSQNYQARGNVNINQRDNER